MDAMKDGSERIAACVICGNRIEGGQPAHLVSRSEQHPERTYRFFVHPACLKRVAKPGFVGVSDL